MKDNNNLQVVKNQLLYLKNKVILIHKNNVGIIKFS